MILKNLEEQIIKPLKITSSKWNVLILKVLSYETGVFLSF
jgi:DNA-binding HxlR family transcriptional regulator